MWSNGEPVDLYKLFKVVKEKGGYDVVCKNSLWDSVGEEYGFGVKVGSSVELVYSKYLSALETWLKNVEFPECGLVDDRVKFRKRLMEAQTELSSDDYGEEEVSDELERRGYEYDYPDGRKLCGTNRVKGMKPESNGAELEKVYDYLDGKLCGTNRVKGMNPESTGAKKVRSRGLVELDMVGHGTNEPILGNLCDHNAAMELLEEFDGGKIITVDASDAESNMPGLSDGDKRIDNDNDDDDNGDEVLILDPSSIDKEKFGCKRKNGDGVLILDPSSVDKEKFGCKRRRGDEVLILDPSTIDKENFGHKCKRDSMSELLSWVTSIAKNPCDSAVGSMPEKSKWKSYGSQEIWKQVLLFREAVFLKKDFETVSEQLNWQAQKMHPCMYDDHHGGTYNLRQRLTCDKRLLLGKSTSDQPTSDSPGGTYGGLEKTPSPHTEHCAKKQLLDSCTARPSRDRCATVRIPVGPNHQAEVPEWTGMTHKSDSKWLGTKIWPLETVNSKLVLERDPIGKGRQDSCGCQVKGSVECVRFHIAQKRSKVKLELGGAFYQWNLYKVGEEVKHSWTEQEEKKFKDVVKSNPASLDRCFWDHLFKTFHMKSREDLVSYYFNVFLLQRRGYQNRHTPESIDSDDDESEFTPLRKAFGHQTYKNSFTLLSPKKAKDKSENGK